MDRVPESVRGGDMSELMLIAVPGYTTTSSTALLRVVFVPRLTGPEATIAQCGLTDWPSLVAHAQLDVTMTDASGASHTLSNVPVRSSGDSTVWRTFFAPAMAVRPFSMATYDAPTTNHTSEHADKLDDAYRAATQAPETTPQVLRQFSAADDTHDVPPPTAPAPFVAPDFHRALAMLRQHPRVMRALGLIVELDLPRGSVSTAGSIQLEWSAPPAVFATAAGPQTRYEIADGRWFVPAQTRVISGGLVRLDATTAITSFDPTTHLPSTVFRPNYLVTSVDVDGAVTRVLDAKAKVIESGETPNALPPLRTAGLTLIHRRQQDALLVQVGRARRNAGSDVRSTEPLDADHLVLGYRVDVRRPGRPWQSLVRRKATYRVAPMPSAAAIPIGAPGEIEEGHVKPAAAVLGTDATLRADEVVVRWAGFNLAIPRPDPLTAPTPATAGDAQHQMPYWFTFDFAEPTDVPAMPLEFGLDYQLRLRVEDIAGGGLEINDPPPDRSVTAPTPYLRQEPAQPPTIPAPDGLIGGTAAAPTLTADYFGPGGSIDVLVVRSDPKGDPAVPVHTAYPANDSRTMLPPAATFSLAEQHNAFSGDPAATVKLAKRALAQPLGVATPRNGRSYTWLPDPAIAGVALIGQPLSADLAPTAVAIQLWGEHTWPDHPAKSVQVHPVAVDAPFRVEWQAAATNATVELPAGQQADIEVSSSLGDHQLDNFAANAWLVGARAGLREDAVLGRHPGVSPPRTLRVVHAVRRPLRPPAAALQAARDLGSTFATVRDPGAPAYGVDRASTAQIEVRARWDEWQDAAAPAAGTQVVQTLAVGLDAAAVAPIHHEFTDTKYRRVTYELTARSRFRDFFAADDPDSCFVSATELPAIDLLSTTAPPPLSVVSIVPAVHWQQHVGTGADYLALQRRGGMLRVELDRPWYVTGAGEQVGVVVAAGDGPGDPNDPMWNAVTTVFQDPVYSVDPVRTQPTENAMRTFGQPAVQVLEPESGAMLSVVPCDVRWDGERPFTDVALPGMSDRYGTFVRLVLVRYQAHSLADRCVSRPITTEAVAVLADRRLLVGQPGDGSVTVSLFGPAPTAATTVEARLETSPVAGFAGELSTLGGLDPDGHAWGEVAQVSGGLNVALPPLPLSGGARRLVVQEFEGLPTFLPLDSDPLATRLGRRVVYTAVVDLTLPPDEPRLGPTGDDQIVTIPKMR
jgi:hypothetical protein